MTAGLCHRWMYFLRTLPNIPNLLEALNKVINYYYYYYYLIIILFGKCVTRVAKQDVISASGAVQV